VSLVTLLRACPNLKSLNLYLLDSQDVGNTWSPDGLLDTLGFAVFPSLTAFRALGAVGQDWEAFFDSPDSNLLRAFLSRHPKLHTVGLGWVDGYDYYNYVDPQSMAALFPSLKHLEAPAFLCAPVLASSLANQLESVTVLDKMFSRIRPNLYAIAQGIAPLPNLRKLALHVDNQKWIEMDHLKRVLRSAPNLEELEYRTPFGEPVCSILVTCGGLLTLCDTTVSAIGSSATCSQPKSAKNMPCTYVATKGPWSIDVGVEGVHFYTSANMSPPQMRWQSGC
jgi:hypothetical protein